MEKQVFLDRVRQTLLERGVAEEVAARQIAKLGQFIDEEGGANVEAMLEEEDPVLLAEEICALLKRNAARRAAAVIEPEEAAAPAAAPTPAAEAVATVEVDENFDVVDLSTEEHKKTEAAPTELSPESIYVPPAADAFDEEVSRRSRKQAKREEREVLEVDEAESRAEAYSGEKGGPMFWVMFIAALPFVAVICALVLALFVAAFAALAVLQVGSFVALAAVAAAGTAFTLVALIYGIVQLLSTLPVGLFELGIAISAGGVVLFCSILLYNLGIRLLPFTMKKLAKFLVWTVKRGKILFIYLKGVCAKL